MYPWSPPENASQTELTQFIIQDSVVVILMETRSEPEAACIVALKVSQFYGNYR